jgi:hypothetical protein
MRIPRTLKHAKAPTRFLQHQEAILSAVARDERQNAWAQELLTRRNAVARWRGQAGCSVRDVMQFGLLTQLHSF